MTKNSILFKRSNYNTFRKRNDRHQLQPMTYLLTISKFHLLLYVREEVPSNTFAKLPVHVLINDPKKLDPRSLLQLQTHHLVMRPTSTSRPKHFHTFLKLPVSALINDPQKKSDGHQQGPMTHYRTTSKFDLLSYIGEKCLQTHLQSFLCMS